MRLHHPSLNQQIRRSPTRMPPPPELREPAIRPRAAFRGREAVAGRQAATTPQEIRERVDSPWWPAPNDTSSTTDGAASSRDTSTEQAPADTSTTTALEETATPAPRPHGEIQSLSVPKPKGLVQIRATDGSANEDGDPGVFTVHRTHAGGELTVAYAVSGTATEGKDYHTLTGTVTFQADDSRETIQIDPIDDLIPDNGETVVLTLTSVSDSQYAIDSHHQSDTVTIHNTESGGGVWIDNFDKADADEATGDNGYFTIVRDGSSGSLTVDYLILTNNSVLGNATEDSDYFTLEPHEVTFENTESTVRVTVTPIMDSMPEGDEKVVLLLTDVSDRNSYKIDSTNNLNTVWISDADSGGSGGSSEYVTVDSYGTDSAYEQGSVDGTFTISRTSSVGSLTVNYEIYGNATEGVGNDYVSLGGRSISLVDGESSAQITIDPHDDLDFEGTERVVLVLTDVTDSSYVIDRYSDIASVWIYDNEHATGSVWITATDAAADEETGEPGEFTIWRTDAVGDLTVSYDVSGTATYAQDYQNLGFIDEVTIPDGQDHIAIPITPLQDTDVEPDESVVLTLTSVSDPLLYTIDTAADSATVWITDDDDIVVTVVATDDHAYESNEDTATFAISRVGDVSWDLTVYYAVSGAAISGSDYQPLPGNIVLPAGQSTVMISLTPINDSKWEPEESMTLSISNDPAYAVGSPGAASIQIVDNDPIVTLAATDPIAHEAGSEPGTFTISRNGYFGCGADGRIHVDRDGNRGR